MPRPPSARIAPPRPPPPPSCPPPPTPVACSRLPPPALSVCATCQYAGAAARSPRSAPPQSQTDLSLPVLPPPPQACPRASRRHTARFAPPPPTVVASHPLRGQACPCQRLSPPPQACRATVCTHRRRRTPWPTLAAASRRPQPCSPSFSAGSPPPPRPDWPSVGGVRVAATPPPCSRPARAARGLVVVCLSEHPTPQARPAAICMPPPPTSCRSARTPRTSVRTSPELRPMGIKSSPRTTSFTPEMVNSSSKLTSKPMPTMRRRSADLMPAQPSSSSALPRASSPRYSHLMS